LAGLIIFAAPLGSGSRPHKGNNGSVFQWIEFQIPILKMQVRFLPGLQPKSEAIK
jgi:hypothetical protein